MDRGNWFVNGMPEPLRYLVEQYEKDMLLPSFSMAIRRLLETHPDIAKRADSLYHESQRLTPTGRSPAQ